VNENTNHHLIDRRSLGHDEEPRLVLPRASRADIDCLERHILETWLIECIGLVAGRRVRLVTKVLGVDLPVEPFCLISFVSYMARG
jgi:hypothetical protein